MPVADTNKAKLVPQFYACKHAEIVNFFSFKLKRSKLRTEWRERMRNRFETVVKSAPGSPTKISGSTEIKSQQWVVIVCERSIIYTNNDTNLISKDVKKLEAPIKLGACLKNKQNDHPTQIERKIFRLFLARFNREFGKFDWGNRRTAPSISSQIWRKLDS